jgi:hypothetical protein
LSGAPANTNGRIANIEERQRQLGQVVRQGDRRGLQFQAAGVADLGPQAGVQRVLAHHGVVTDQLQGQAVEPGDQVRRDIHHLLLQATGTFLGHRQAGRHLVVDHQVDLRQVGQQRRRVAVLQMQPGAGHHLIGAHVEAHAVATFDTAQVHGVVGTQLLEGGAVGRQEIGRCRLGGLDLRDWLLDRLIGPGGSQQRQAQC